MRSGRESFRETRTQGTREDNVARGTTEKERWEGKEREGGRGKLKTIMTPSEIYRP